jgi:hypothetical protein
MENLKCMSLNTNGELEHLKNCEAVEWHKRYQEKKQMLGSRKAHAWWMEVLEDLRRIRGESATLDLRQRMNRLKDEK